MGKEVGRVTFGEVMREIAGVGQEFGGGVSVRGKKRVVWGADLRRIAARKGKWGIVFRCKVGKRTGDVGSDGYRLAIMFDDNVAKSTGSIGEALRDFGESILLCGEGVRWEKEGA